VDLLQPARVGPPRLLRRGPCRSPASASSHRPPLRPWPHRRPASTTLCCVELHDLDSGLPAAFPEKIPPSLQPCPARPRPTQASIPSPDPVAGVNNCHISCVDGPGPTPDSAVGASAKVLHGCPSLTPASGAFSLHQRLCRWRHCFASTSYCAVLQGGTVAGVLVTGVQHSASSPLWVASQLLAAYTPTRVSGAALHCLNVAPWGASFFW